MCDYCKADDTRMMDGETEIIFEHPFDVSAWLSEGTLYNKHLVVMVGDSVMMRQKIHYCPMCGRSLDEPES